MLTGRERDRQRPHRSIAELGVLDNALVVAASLEAVERRVGSAAQEPEVCGRSLRDTQRGEVAGARAELSKLVWGHQQIDQRSPER